MLSSYLSNKPFPYSGPVQHRRGGSPAQAPLADWQSSQAVEGSWRRPGRTWGAVPSLETRELVSVQTNKKKRKQLGGRHK